MNQSSKYQVGESVIVNNKRGSTRRIGVVSEVIWHHKDECYNYYLLDTEGKKISKRYFEDELKQS